MLRLIFISALILPLFACSEPADYSAAQKTLDSVFQARSKKSISSELKQYHPDYLKESKKKVTRLIKKIYSNAGKYKSAELIKKGTRNYIHKNLSGQVIILKYLVKYRGANFSETYLLYPTNGEKPKIVLFDLTLQG